MRRILVDNARRKGRQKHGGGRRQIELQDLCLAVEASPEGLIALDEALSRLAARDSEAARLIELTCFGGLTLDQAAEVLGVSSRTAYRHWAFARAWLYAALVEGPGSQ
jgi:RNA polymerase sigma factor (TIGR02999 family)